VNAGRWHPYCQFTPVVSANPFGSSSINIHHLPVRAEVREAISRIGPTWKGRLPGSAAPSEGGPATPANGPARLYGPAVRCKSAIERTGWRAPEGRHPLDAARAGLDSIAPVGTGIRTTSIKDLIKEYPNRESLEKLTDAELLRSAAREVAMAVVIITRTIQARATSLVSTNAGGLADLLKSVATALNAVGSTFVQALTLRRGG
jgi:hypothetical protein